MSTIKFEARISYPELEYPIVWREKKAIKCDPITKTTVSGEPLTPKEQKDMKYSCQIIIPKTDTNTVKMYENAVNEAIIEGRERFGKAYAVPAYKAGMVLPQNVKMGLVDGDLNAPEDPNKVGCWYITSTNMRKVKCVGRQRGVEINPADIYPGEVCRFILNLRAFLNVSKGVSNHVQAVQSTGTGESFIDSVDVETAFDYEEILLTSAEDLSFE